MARSPAPRAACALLAVVLALALALAVVPVPAGAQQGPVPAPIRFELAGVDRAWVAPGGAMTMQLRVDGAPPGLEINLVVHQAVNSRTGFEQTIEGEDLGSVLGQLAVPLDLLPTDATGTRSVTVPVQDPAAPRDPNRLPHRGRGVYPLEVELRGADGVAIAGFVTHLVVVAPPPDDTQPVGQRLRVAWVWPVVAPPAFLPDGGPDPSVVEALGPDGRLGREADALAAAAGVPVTLAPGPETLDSWTSLAADDPDLAGTLAALRSVLAEPNQVLPGPYVPINVPSLVAGGLAPEVNVELLRGTSALNSALATGLEASTLVTGPLDDAAFVRLRDAGVGRIILDGAQLVPRESDFTPAEPFLLQSADRSATATASDTGLTDVLAGDAPPALRAQQFLAGLSVVALEQPNLRRGVTVLNPPGWDPPAELLATALAGLRDHPFLQPVTVDGLLSDVEVDTEEDGAPVVRELEGILVPPPPVSATSFSAARSRLESFRSLVSAGDLRVAQGERALLIALSSELEGDAADRAREELAVIDEAIDDVLSRLRVPVGSTVTLTARRGEIPVTFLNETDQTLRVRVTLESDRLFFPDGAQRDLELPPRNTTVGFTVESRASGTFPLELTVTSTDGLLTIKETDVRVRSTFVSGVGLFLTVGAALFLAVWWLVHFLGRRGRRAARAAHPVAAAPSEGGPPPR